MNIKNPYIYSFSHNYIHVDSVYFGPLASPFERVIKPTLTEIVDNGKQMMMEAVDFVIAKHERNIELIKNEKAVIEKVGKWLDAHDDGVGKVSALSFSQLYQEKKHRKMMASTNQHQLDSLANGFVPRNLSGDRSPLEQQLRNIEAKSFLSSICVSRKSLWQEGV
jgi:hypothetical protein